MKPSTERILTTHVGSLARADSLIPLLRLRENGQPYDPEELARLVREAVADVVRKQVEAGIDIVWPWLKFAAWRRAPDWRPASYGVDNKE